MLTKTLIAATTALVLATSYSAAVAAPKDRAQATQSHSNFVQTWFALPEGRDSM